MHERATVAAAVPATPKLSEGGSAAVVARLLANMASAPIAATNKLSHRLNI